MWRRKRICCVHVEITHECARLSTFGCVMCENEVLKVWRIQPSESARLLVQGYGSTVLITRRCWCHDVRLSLAPNVYMLQGIHIDSYQTGSNVWMCASPGCSDATSWSLADAVEAMHTSTRLSEVTWSTGLICKINVLLLELPRKVLPCPCDTGQQQR